MFVMISLLPEDTAYSCGFKDGVKAKEPELKEMRKHFKDSVLEAVMDCNNLDRVGYLYDSASDLEDVSDDTLVKVTTEWLDEDGQFLESSVDVSAGSLRRCYLEEANSLRENLERKFRATE